eukprot:TRINITY_DN1457_c1_g1_i1.p2 TRINITY_DN1457_c1_g1~~TRINITY_DN1457_c1_g1_i1.p2  ORF type:complete len:142 (+),score=12.22 TRINITY_DN1457_c1_g1_i1:15-440(+)
MVLVQVPPPATFKSSSFLFVLFGVLNEMEVIPLCCKQKVFLKETFFLFFLTHPFVFALQILQKRYIYIKNNRKRKNQKKKKKEKKQIEKEEEERERKYNKQKRHFISPIFFFFYSSSGKNAKCPYFFLGGFQQKSFSAFYP